jgi:integrase
VVSVGLALGLRIGEALGLRWTDVDFDAGLIHVEQALERSGGDAAARKRFIAVRTELLKQLRATDADQVRRQLRARIEALRIDLRSVQMKTRFVEPKSPRSRRAIRMPVVVITRLKQHRKRQLEERLLAGSRWEESGLVFTTTIGTALDPRNVSRDYKTMLRAAELPSIRFHDLRHTAATLLLAQGVDPRTIMETLGHSQISLTLNTYSHVLPTLQAEAATKMNAILGGN